MMKGEGRFLFVFFASLIWSGCDAQPGNTLLRWCCRSESELLKCQSIFENGNGYFTCVSSNDCGAAITSGEADVSVMHGSTMIQYQDGLQVIGYEDTGLGNASYYGIAVVKNSGKHFTMCDLESENIKSCHTAIMKSSGWVTPMGTIARHYTSQKREATDFILHDPFEASCAPGAKNPFYTSHLPKANDRTGKYNDKKWCALCVGDGNENSNTTCVRDRRERYYGYYGAFVCLKEGAGDVAFIKQTIVPPEEQAAYSLLCKNGSRAPYSEWRSCNLARVPSQAVVMRIDASSANANRAMTNLQTAKDNTDEETFTAGRYWLWSNKVKSFENWPENFPTTSYGSVRDYLGEDYYCNILAVNEDPRQGFCSRDPLEQCNN